MIHIHVGKLVRGFSQGQEMKKGDCPNELVVSSVNIFRMDPYNLATVLLNICNCRAPQPLAIVSAQCLKAGLGLICDSSRQD